MSNLVMFSIQDEIDYFNKVRLSELLIDYCLLNKKGVIFNFLGYSEDFISELHPHFYFSVSDDFIQLNSEFMTTCDIENIQNAKGKEKFIEKFSFLSDIFQILVDFGLLNFSLVIACDGSDDDIEDFDTKYINETTSSLTDVLYDHIINMSHYYAYEFSNVIISYQNP